MQMQLSGLPFPVQLELRKGATQRGPHDTVRVPRDAELHGDARRDDIQRVDLHRCGCRRGARLLPVQLLAARLDRAAAACRVPPIERR